MLLCPFLVNVQQLLIHLNAAAFFKAVGYADNTGHIDKSARTCAALVIIQLNTSENSHLAVLSERQSVVVILEHNNALRNSFGRFIYVFVPVENLFHMQFPFPYM